jgi:hypothetical protein
MAHRRRTREQWRRLVAGWPESGLTQADYCERHAISVASLHRWREVFGAQPGTATPAPSARKPRDAVHLLPIQLLGEPGSAAAGGAGQALSLVVPDGSDCCFGAQTQVYVVAGATDMRKQIDGLAALVVDVLQTPP